MINEDGSGRGESRGRRVEAHEGVARWRTDGGKRMCGGSVSLPYQPVTVNSTSVD